MSVVSRGFLGVVLLSFALACSGQPEAPSLAVSRSALSEDPVGSCTNTTTVSYNVAPVCDTNHLLLPAYSPFSQAYDVLLKKNWSFFSHLPVDPCGKQPFFCYSYMSHNSTWTTVTTAGWGSDPGDHNSMLAEASLRYYAYTGDASAPTLVEQMLDWHLAHGLTASTGSWPSMPYDTGDPGSTTYGGTSIGTDGYNTFSDVIEVPLLGAMGYAWLTFYEYDNTRSNFRDEAIAIADQLAAHQRTTGLGANVSPWPFRVRSSNNAATGKSWDAFSADVVDPLTLFDELLKNPALGTTTQRNNWSNARTVALNWLLNATYGPIVTGNWLNWFEDVYADSETNLIPLETAKYFLNKQTAADVNWLADVKTILTWTESNASGTDNSWGSPAVLFNGTRRIMEQSAFAHPMGSHTSRYAAVKARLYELDSSASASAKDVAYRSLNWASYQIKQGGPLDGMGIDSEFVPDGSQKGAVWFTDGWGDLQRNFLTAMAAVPDLAPAGQTHLLRSSSIVKSVSYGASAVSYTTVDTDAVEVLRLASPVVSVVIGGTTYNTPRADLSAQGYTWTNTADLRGNPLQVVRVRHTTSASVTVNTGAATVPGAPTIGTATAGNASATVSFTAPASDGGSPITSYTATCGTVAASGSGSPITVTGLVNGTAYTCTVKATNAVGTGAASAASNSVTPSASATLAVDKVATTNQTSAGTTMSGSITPTGAGELLLAFLSSDGGPGGGSQSFTVSGGGLTWTLVKRTNTQPGDAEIWRAVSATAGAAVNVTATRSGSYLGSITLVAFTGARTTGVGATGSGNSASGAATASLTTTVAGSWVWGVGSDWNTATARTVGSAQTKVAEDLASSGDTYWVQRMTATTPSVGTVVTLNTTAPSNAQYNFSTVEVLPQ